MTEKKQSSENQTKKQSPRQVSTHPSEAKTKKKQREKRRLFNTLRYQVGIPPTLALILPSLANASDDTGDEGNIAESHALTPKATGPHENTQAPDSEAPTSPSSEHQERAANSDDTESGHTHALPSRHLALHHYPMHAYTAHHIVNQSGTASSARDNHVDGIAPFSVSTEKTQQTDKVHKSPHFNSAPKMLEQAHAVKEDDAIFHGKMVATDADGDTLSYVISKPIDGLTFHSDGSYTFDPSHSAFQHLAQGTTEVVSTTVIVTDSMGGKHSEQLQFTVTGTNDAPKVTGQFTGALKEDVNVDSSGLMHVHGKVDVVDADQGESHTLSEVVQGKFGVLDIDSNGHWHYQVDNSLPAIQQLASGNVITEQITIHTADQTPQLIEIVIGGTADSAVISGVDSGAVKEDLNVVNGSVKTSGDLSVIDSDHGQSHFLSQVLVGQFGTLTMQANGHWQYEANNQQTAIQELAKGTHLSETFTVSSVDGTAHNIDVQIDGTNDLPVMAGQSQSLKEDGAVFHGQMVATDVDQDLLTYSTSNPIDGLTFNPDGSYTFDPSHSSYQHLAIGDTQTVKTTVIVTGTAGGQDQKELSFVIEGTNDKPSVTPITAQFHEDQSQHLDINLLSHSQDVDGDTLNVGSLFQVKVNGHIERLPDGFGIVNGHLQVDPSSSTFQHLAQGEVATFELSYKVTDSHGASTPQSVTVKIVGTDDKAQLVSSSINIGEAAAEHTYHGTSIKGALQLTDIDTTDNPQFVDMIYQSSSRLGALALRADGHYEYFLQGNYVGTANAQKTVAALKPGESITETFNVKTADGQTKPVTVTIHGEEDSAQIVVNYGTTDNHLHEDSMTSPAYPTELFATGIVKAIDPDHDDDQLKPHTLVSTHGGHFTVTETGMWQYHIDNSLPAIQQLGKGESFQEQFTVESKDGSAQKVITVTVHGTNDDPDVSSAVTLPPGHEDKPYIISGAALLANASDVDANDAGHLSVASLVALKADGSSAGTITDNHNGSFTFTPELNYNGPVRFSYEVHDGHGGSVVTSASASLKPVSDNAQISYASTDHHLAGVTEDRGYIDTHDKLHFEGKLDIVDPDQGEAIFDINYGPQTYTGIGYDTKLGGHILLMRDGHYTYTIRDHQPQVQSLSQGEVLTDQCVVRAKDGTTFTIEVNIHGTNDAPTLSAQTQAVTEDGNSLNGQMQGRDIDHGATLTYSIAHAIDGLTFNADGSYSFNPSHASYQQLKDGEHKIIDIPVTVTDEHGATSTQNLTINVQGTGDAAVIGGVDTGDVHENQAGQDKSPDYAQPGIGVIGQDSLTTSGQLTIVDPDSGESVFDPNGKVYSYSGQYGHLLLRPDGHWEYAVAAGTHDWHLGSTKTTVGSTIDQLGQGETLTDTVTVHSKDGTTHDIVITIHGDNDAPYVSSEVVLQSGKEDVSQTFTKADLLANAVDVDSNDAGLLTVANLLSDHGSIRDNHDGTYTYTPELNYHGKVHFSYDISDAHGGSTPTSASLDLASANDASVLAAGQGSGSVTEDHLRSGTASPLWSGWTNLDVTDVDGASEAEVAFIEVNGIQHAVPADFAMNLTANHGYFSTTHSTDGHNKWSYTADNRSSEIQGLKTGQQLQDTMVLITKDGTRIPVTATIQGEDDHVIIDTPDALTAAIGTAIEDIKTTVVGMLQAHDLDKGDHVSFELAGSASSQAGSYGTFYVDRAGHWHYDLDASKVDSLRSGDGKAEAFNIVAISSDGSRATQKVEILVKGTDDAAIITGQSTGSVTEDLHVQGDARHTVFTGGVLDAKDPDIGQRGFHQTLNAHAISDPYGGSLSIDKAGGWIYSVPNGNLQHLAQGETQHVQYQVQTLGGDTHVITVDIVGTNDTPTLTAQTQTVNEDGSLLNGQMQGSDIDHGATLAYSIAKPVNGLAFNADGSYTFDPTNASYDHLAKGQTQTLTIPVTVTDEHGASTTQNLEIVITGSNDAAKASGVDTGDVRENQAGQDMSPDYAQPGMSKISHDALYASGQLSIVDPDTGEAKFDTKGGIYSYHGQYGHLLLREDGHWDYKVAAGQNDWLRQGTSTTVGTTIDKLGSGETLTDTITIQTKDGTTHDIVITIHGDNDAPYVSGEVLLNTGKEDLPQVITSAELLANSIDVDHNDQGQLTIANLVADHGSILDNQDGTYTFTPDRDYNGQVHFNYDVVDAHGGTTHTGANTILVAVNDRPDVQPITDRVKEDSTNNHPVDLLAGSTDKEGDTLSVSQISYSVDGATATTSLPDGLAMGADGHSVIVDATHSTFQHLAVGQTQQIVVSYLVDDGHGGQTPQSATLTVEGADDKAVLTSNVIQMSESEALLSKTKTYHGNLQLTDPDTGDHTQFVFSGQYMGQGYAPGSLYVWPDGSYEFRLESARNRHADDLIDSLHRGESMEIPYQVRTSDGQRLNIIVKVIGEDDQARIVVGQYSSLANHAYEDNLAPGSTPNQVWSGGNLHVIDPDHGQAGFVTQSFDTPEGGHFSINVRGGWQYTIDNAKLQHLGDGQSYQKTFTVESIDGTAQQTITVTVHGTNDTPVVTSAVRLSQGTEDTPVTLNAADLLTHASDVDDHSLLSVHNLSVDHGLVVDNLDGTFSFTPEKNYHGQVQFTYDVKDEHGASVSTSATMNLTAVNDAATFTGDSASLVEDTNLQHNTRFAGSSTIQDALFCRGSLVISDVDGQGEAALDLKGQHQISQDGTYGHFLIKPDGTWVYTADNSNTNIQDLDNGQSLTDSIEITSIDGTKHSISVTISGSTDKPTIHSFTDSGVQNTGPIEGNLISGVGTSQGTAAAATDSDSNAHLVLQDIQIQDPVSGNYVVVTPGHPHAIAGIGTLAIEANGHYIFTPEAGFTGKIPNMVYRVGDDGGTPVNDFSQNTLSIEVKPPAQHAPTVTPQTVTSDEDQSHIFTAAEFGYQDADHDALNHITITQLPSHGLLTLNGVAVTTNQQISKADLDAGHLTFTPIQNQSGANYAHFEFRANDGHQDSTSASMSIDVNAINDAPVLHITPVTPITGQLTNTDPDIGDVHHYSVASSTGRFGQLTLDPDTGDYKYVPSGQLLGMQYHTSGNQYTAKDTFEVTVTDGAGATSTRYMTFDLNGNMTAPTIQGQRPGISVHVTGLPTVTTAMPSHGSSVSQPANRVSIDLVTASDSGQSHTDNVTNQTTPTIAGHTDIPFSEVKLYDGPNAVGSGYSDAQGNYQISTTALTNGVHNLSAKALAPSGLVPAVSSLLPVTIDTQPPRPVLTVDTIATDDVINAHESQGSVAITGSVSGDAQQGDVVTLKVGGHSYSGTVDASRHYHVDVPGAELAQTTTVHASITSSDLAGNVGTASVDHQIDVDMTVASPTISFESAGSDRLYSKAEIARGAAGTVTATVHAASDAKVGEHLNINGVDHVLDANAIQHGIQLEVAPNTVVKAVMTDEHGNVSSALNVSAGAKPEPIVVTAPSGSHHISASLGVPTLMPSQTPIPSSQQGWKILVGGHYQTSYTSQWGTLSIDPKTGHLSYQEHANVHTGPHGSAQNVGVHEDHFQIALQGSHHDDVVLHVQVSILSHGPGHSGKLTLGTEVLDMTVTPILSHNPPPPPPPPSVAYDEPDLSSTVESHQELTIMAELGISAKHIDEDSTSPKHIGASNYLQRLGIEHQDSHTDTTGSDLPDDIDIVLNEASAQESPIDHHSDVSHHDEHSGMEHLQDSESHHHDLDDPTMPDDPTR